jgi:hypothetical protein
MPATNITNILLILHTLALHAITRSAVHEFKKPSPKQRKAVKPNKIRKAQKTNLPLTAKSNHLITQVLTYVNAQGGYQ